MRFVPLHLYSGYSFLRSGLSIHKILLSAKKAGYSQVGLSDFETLSGYPEFYHAFENSGITPTFGMDVEIDGTIFSLFLNCEEGYKNLIKIAYEKSKGPIDLSFLKEHQEGLVVVLPAETSPIHDLYKDNLEGVVSYLLKTSKGFSRFYLGIPYLPKEEGFLSFLREFTSKYPYDKVAFPHILYAKANDAIVLDIVRAIAEKTQLSEREKVGDNYFLSQEEAASYFSEDEIANSEKIASSSSFVFLQKRGGLLVYPTPEGETSSSYLRKLAYEGLAKRNPGYSETYKERLDYELAVIDKMGYSDYFLIVADYVNYAKKQNIPVGPGRGSGAGSLVSYALNIVTPDPIKYDLLFERFLNPERKTMPDIDVDFSDLRREEVVKYLQKRYGTERVSHIVTMQTIGPRESLRDIGRVYNYEQREIDLIAKTILFSDATLADSYRHNKAFRSLIDSDKYYLGIVQLAAKIEGLPRQAGLHAAGIVLNDKPLDEAIPVFEDPNIGSVAGFEMNYLQEQGFLKMDLLGLRNLTIIEETIMQVKANGGPDIDLLTIPWEDKDAIRLIASGKTMGLFQLESAGMKRAIKEIDPECFDDVVALLALFRPGPMANIPSYARRKKGLEQVNYLVPEFKNYLASTYGIIVYQEQIVQIVRAMTNASLGKADVFRRAISKKDTAKLLALKDDFIRDSIAAGHNKALSEKVFDLIFRFANYGFNKSHSLSYAILACQMAYLKLNYPLEFYASVLDNGEGAGSSKFAETISEIKKMHITLALPDINEASTHYVVHGDKLYYPLSAIKNLPNMLAKNIVNEREVHGPYSDIYDFAKRVKPYGLSLVLLVRLIDAGALDSIAINGNRSQLRASASGAMSYADMFSTSSGQPTLFELNIPKPVLKDVPNDVMENLEAEKEALGIMISGSPLSFYENEISKINYTPLGEIDTESGDFLTIGAVKSIRTITTKKGSTMAFLGVYDDTKEADFTLFSEAYDAAYPLLKKDNVLLLKGHKDTRREDTYILDSASAIEKGE
jgi:DNA polymerase-3 subunit alpha